MITIDTSPLNFQSVFIPILFELTSDKTLPELKLKCEVEQYDSGSWKVIATQIIDPISQDGASSYFSYYCHQALNNAIVTQLPTGNHGDVITDTGSMIQYRVQFTELKHDANQLYEEADTATSAAAWCSNIVIQSRENLSITDFPFIPGDGLPLTIQPLEREVKPNQPVVISYVYDESEYSGLTPQIAAT